MEHRKQYQVYDTYYLSDDARKNAYADSIPHHGLDSKSVYNIINDIIVLDYNPYLNTSSYVNVLFEELEEKILIQGMKINLADQTSYPNSFKVHNRVINMIGNLWHCPDSEGIKEYGVFAGAGTVGSTEACILAGLALKFRWRAWYAKKYKIDKSKIYAARPNLIISSLFQAAWEKFFRYMDVEPRIIKVDSESFCLDPEKIKEHVDENTIGIVGIMGNHWGGHYDPIWEIDKVVEEINNEKGFQLGIHVDGASGGFIAPFQEKLPKWDFRLKNVLSISASGHKYGESCLGTGWVVWRHRENLSEHISTCVTYLGGKSESYTMNFSRPASSCLVQYYKLLRFGFRGLKKTCDYAMENASFLRHELSKMEYNGQKRFVFLDAGDKNCLPVVSLRLNPKCNLNYTDIDLQNDLSRFHWYVSAYKLATRDPLSEESLPLFNDLDTNDTMFRIVVKGNLIREMCEDLLSAVRESLDFLDKVNFEKINLNTKYLKPASRRILTNHC